MRHAPAPHAHRVKVREVSTGTVVERWPVDARAIVAQSNGTWEYVPADEATPQAAQAAPARQGAPATADTLSATAATPAPDPSAILAQLEGKSYTELKALAKQAGIVGNIPKADLAAALVPHIVGRTVSLDPVKGLPPVLPANQFPTQAEG